jgi:hypothetical protein
MEDLLLSFKRNLENLYFPCVYNIKSIPFVFFLEDEATLIKGALKRNGLDFFKLGG